MLISEILYAGRYNPIHIFLLISDRYLLSSLLTNSPLLFQIPPRVIDRHPDQSPGLGAHRHAQWAAPNQDLPRETLLQERRHAGKDAPLQPALGAAR